MLPTATTNAATLPAFESTAWPPPAFQTTSRTDCKLTHVKFETRNFGWLLTSGTTQSTSATEFKNLAPRTQLFSWIGNWCFRVNWLETIYVYYNMFVHTSYVTYQITGDWWQVHSDQNVMPSCRHVHTHTNNNTHTRTHADTYQLGNMKIINVWFPWLQVGWISVVYHLVSVKLWVDLNKETDEFYSSIVMLCCHL